MKKLKFLLIPLFSLLFLINVKADTITRELYYGTNAMTKLENYETLLSNAIQYLRDNASTIDSLNSNINLTNDENVVKFDLTYNTTLTSPLRVNIIYNISNSLLYQTGRYPYYKISNVYYYDFSLNFDSNYNITGYNIGNIGYQDFNFSYSDTPNGGIYQNFYLDYRLGANSSLNFTNNTSNTTNFLIGPQANPFEFDYGDNITLFDFANYLYFGGPTEPTYTYQETILDSGNVKIDFTFTNYVEGGGYGFEILNNTSNEYYGISNPYTSVYNNIIPFGNSYSIEIPYDSLLYVTLASYERIEQTDLYYRTEIYTNIIDVNNIVFENNQDPYFTIYTQNKNNITGTFVNTTNQMTCWYSYSDSSTEDYLPCNEEVGFNVHDNGYVEVIIKKGNNTIYTRKINYIGANDNEPYIVYEVIKRDFYSVINWHIENNLSNTTYRYSTNNGTNYTNWETYTNNDNIINVFDNSTIIIEIANSNQSSVYDSKAIVVINDITNIKNTNNTTTNFINKFRSIFNVNSKILQNIENYYNTLRNSKIYLLIFIPFITSLICAIIYLIRRK